MDLEGAKFWELPPQRQRGTAEPGRVLSPALERTTVRKQCASAYERGGYIFLSPSSLTEGGLWVGSEPLVKLEQALNNSKVGVPHPARHEWEAVAKPLLDLAGVKTWDQFAQNSTLCEVERTAGTIRFIPT